MLQQPAAIVVFVAQVDVDGFGAHDLGGDQQSFEEAVRVALQVMAVLEGAGLALIDVDGHQPGGGLLAHDAPLAPGRKTCAAQAAQARVLQRSQNGVGLVLAVDHGGGEAVAALRTVVFVSYCIDSYLCPFDAGERLILFKNLAAQALRHARCVALSAQGLHRCFHGRWRGQGQGLLTGQHGGRLLATADARRLDHAHRCAQQRGQARKQLARARHLAAQPVAHPHGKRGGRGVILEDLEVVIEAGHLEDLDQG